MKHPEVTFKRNIISYLVSSILLTHASYALAADDAPQSEAAKRTEAAIAAMKQLDAGYTYTDKNAEQNKTTVTTAGNAAHVIFTENNKNANREELIDIKNEVKALKVTINEGATVNFEKIDLDGSQGGDTKSIDGILPIGEDPDGDNHHTLKVTELYHLINNGTINFNNADQQYNSHKINNLKNAFIENNGEIIMKDNSVMNFLFRSENDEPVKDSTLVYVNNKKVDTGDHALRLTADKVYFYNRSDAEVINNEPSRIEISANEATLRNDGNIDDIRVGNIEDYWSNATYENKMKAFVENNKTIKNISVHASDVDFKNNKDAEINELTIIAPKLKFVNEGTIKTVNDIKFEVASGEIINKGTLGNMVVSKPDFGANQDNLPNEDWNLFKPEKLDLHLEGSTVGNVYIDRTFKENDPARDGYDDDSGATYGETVVYIDSKTKTLKMNTEDGISTPDLTDGNYTVVDELPSIIVDGKGEDDVLVLLDAENFRKIDGSKISGFEVLKVKDSHWDFKKGDITFPETIVAEDAEIKLNGGKLISNTVNIGDSSNLYIKADQEASSQSDAGAGAPVNFNNDGKIIFAAGDQDPVGKHHTFTIKGNYDTVVPNTSGDQKGYIAMRVDVTKKPVSDADHDLVKIEGDAKGETKVEIGNPGSTLKKRMKQEVKLIETKTSDAKAFSLVKRNFGLYRYSLKPKAEGAAEQAQVNWYLSQKLNGIGNIGASLLAAQGLFDHTYYQRNGVKINPEDRLWLQVKQDFSRNNISSHETSIDIDSTSTAFQMGYDLGRAYDQNPDWNFGAFASYGFDKTKSNETGDPDKIDSKLKAYGVGLYASWEKDNWYVDSWLSYNRLKNTIESDDEKIGYRLTSKQLSVEAGYQHSTSLNDRYNLAFKPQLQTVFTSVSQLNAPELEDTWLIGRHNNRTRLGLRATLQNKEAGFSPFFEVNGNYNHRTLGVGSEDELFYLGGRKYGEIKLGFERFNLTQNLSLWGHAAYQFGNQQYRDRSIHLGLNHRF